MALSDTPLLSRRSLPAPLLSLAFAGTLFGSALLLFAVQPMFARMVLPVLGGTPAVWSVAMVVFQVLLLGGYAYAHALARTLDVPRAAILHGLVSAAALATLPLAMAKGWGVPPADGEALWLVGLFVVSVGLPFFVLSATGPLVQAWFARTDHPASGNPYLLYAASNLGSFVALLGYPLLAEPLTSLATQAHVWSAAFGVVVASVAFCGALAARSLDVRAEAPAAAPVARPAWRLRLHWVALAAVPSGLLVAVTAHIQTDVAAVPLLWVVPLALFLLTFILAFRDRILVPDAWLGAGQAVATVLVLLTLKLNGLPGLAVVTLPLAVALFFVDALIAHRALYRSRPDPAHLTTFYLCLSLGGALGGLFAGLLAPHVFSTILEYPLLLVAALACRVALAPPAWRTAWDEARPILAALAAGLALTVVAMALSDPFLVEMVVLVVLALAVVTQLRSAVRCAVLGLALWLAVQFGPPLIQGTTESHRSFFGVHRVVDTPDGRFRLLFHGTTMHGAMRLANDDGTPFTGTPEPTTYYAAGGAIADTLEVVRRATGGPIRSVGIVGLGAGSLACHRRPGEAWSYFEIDPEVIRLARDPARFRFLPVCGPDIGIVQGDARLTLAAPGDRLRLLIVDAFSSDTVPTHLLTREAMQVYRNRLDEGGALVFHISNRHFNLGPVLARLAGEQGWTALRRDDEREAPLDSAMRAAASVVLLTADPATAEAARALGWRDMPAYADRTPWTDDHVNLLQALWDKQKGSPAAKASSPAQ